MKGCGADCVEESAAGEDRCKLLKAQYVAIAVCIILFVACGIYVLEYLGLIPMLYFWQGNFWDPNPYHQLIALIICVGVLVGVAFYFAYMLFSSKGGERDDV